MLVYSKELFQKRLSLELAVSKDPPKFLIFNAAEDTPRLLKITDDTDFVHAAYMAILGREPDEAGLAGYLEALRKQTPRREVIKRMAASHEAKVRIKYAATIDALKHNGKPPMLNRLREGVLGKARQVLNQILVSRFDAIDFRLSSLMNNMAERDQALSAKLEGLSARLDSLAAPQADNGAMRRFQTLVKPGMVVVDAGAHTGSFALVAASTAVRVHAFEPTPGLLQQSLPANLTVHRTALTDHDGPVRLAVFANHPGQNTIIGPPRPNAIEVPGTTLDTALAAEPRVDLVHISVAGAETLVLRGMKSTIANHPNLQILVEFTHSTASDLLAEAKALGLQADLTDNDILAAFDGCLLLQRPTSKPA